MLLVASNLLLPASSTRYTLCRVERASQVCSESEGKEKRSEGVELKWRDEERWGERGGEMEQETD